MKRQFYSKLLFLFALLLTVSTSVWAEEVTLAAGTNGSACTVNGKDGIKVGTSKGGGNMTITVPANTTKLSLHAAAWKGVTNLSVNITGGTALPASISLSPDDGISNNSPFTLAGNESDFLFEITLSDITAQTTLTLSAGKRFVVWDASAVVSSGGGSETQKCAIPTFSPEAGTYAETQNVTISTTTEGATIYYTTDGNDPTTSSTVYTAPVSVSTSQTLKAIATASGYDNSSVATAAYTIVTIEHAGTETDPYTVADARNAIDANTGITGVYAKGIVSRIYSSSVNANGQISYYISEDGQTTSPELEAYNGLNIGGAAFTALDDIQVGDEVVIYGDLTKWNTTYEFAAENQLVSLKRPVSEEPSIDVAKTSVMVDYTGEENGAIEVTYNNIDSDLAEVQWFENDGLTFASYEWITAEIDANKNIEYLIIEENNTGAARTAYLKVYALDNDLNEVYSDLITITQAKAPEEFTVTYYIAGEKFTTTRLEGAALNLTAPDARGGYQFAGWSTANDAAAPVFVENTAAVNSDLTLYAIFAKEVGETVYTKVTATEDITDGKYLIVYEDGNVAFDGSLETLDGVSNTVEVNFSENNNIESTETVDAATFTIDATAGTIKSASGFYIGRTEYNNGLETSASEQYTNTFSFDNDGNVVISAVVGNQNPTLRYNKASNQNRFRYYKSGQEAIQLYKQTSSATYTLNEPEATITAAANATWVAPAKVKITSADVQVYTVTYDDAVGCTRKHEVLDKVVPANGVVLLTSKTAPTTTTTVTLENTDAEATDFTALENDLLGSDGTRKGGTNIFCLAVGEKGLGFYPVDSSIKVPAGKAYLKIGEDETPVENAPSYIWFNDDTTGIDSLTTDTAAGNESGEIYSLTGQRVGKNYRGIVIMNGRKVLKK